MADIETLKAQAAAKRDEREAINLQIETLKQAARRLSAELVPIETEIARLTPKPKGLVTRLKAERK